MQNKQRYSQSCVSNEREPTYPEVTDQSENVVGCQPLRRSHRIAPYKNNSTIVDSHQTTIEQQKPTRSQSPSSQIHHFRTASVTIQHETELQDKVATLISTVALLMQKLSTLKSDAEAEKAMNQERLKKSELDFQFHQMVCNDQQKQIHELGEKLEVTNSQNIQSLQADFQQLSQNLEILKK